MRTFIFSAALLSLLPLSQAHAGSALSAGELRSLAPGSYDVEVMDTVSLTVKLFANGQMSGNTGGQRDTGHWHVSGDRLCISWNKWLGGHTKCSSLVEQNGALQGEGLTIKRI